MVSVFPLFFFSLRINVLFRAVPHGRPSVHGESNCVRNYESVRSINVCVCVQRVGGWSGKSTKGNLTTSFPLFIRRVGNRSRWERVQSVRIRPRVAISAVSAQLGVSCEARARKACSPTQLSLLPTTGLCSSAATTPPICPLYLLHNDLHIPLIDRHGNGRIGLRRVAVRTMFR